MANTLERDIERKLNEAVKRRGGLCLKWVCPGWVGVPDRIVLMPGGRVYFVELKRPKGGKVSAMQVWWHQQLEALGFRHLIIRDEEQLRLFEYITLLNQQQQGGQKNG